MDARGRAIEQLYRARYANFRKALATVTGSYESAHDAVQEAFARALKERGQFRGSSLEAWVWTIALHTALAQRRADGRSLNGVVIDPVVVKPGRDPELTDALRELSPRRRLVVFLRYFGDCSYATIAEVCGIREGTVAATLSQALRQLESTLTEEVSR